MGNPVKIFDGYLGEGEHSTKFAIIRVDPSVRDPNRTMDEAVARYVGDTPHNQFVDITLCDPWTRLIVHDIRKLRLLTMEQHRRNNRIESIIG